MSEELTVIVPVWNEAESVSRVLDEIARLPFFDWMLVLVIDDGSADGTAELTDGWASRYSNCRSVHVEHGGKDMALWHGIRLAKTEWIGVMDGDGQYDPADLEKLLAFGREEDADGVWGLREDRKDNVARRMSSRLALTLKQAILRGCAVSDSGCGMFVAKREACERIVRACPRPRGQLHCHLADLLVAQGGRIMELPVSHRERPGGVGKYGLLNRIMPGLLSLMQARELRGRGMFPTD